MNGFIELCLGPLTALECRRSLSRKWVLIVRPLLVLAPALVVLTVLWAWWFAVSVSSSFSPAHAISLGLLVLEWMNVTIALVLGPALLAGSLAGEKVQGTLGLLLAALVSSREIVLARLLGQLCVVAGMVGVGLPALTMLASLSGHAPLAMVTLVALSAAVMFGSSGMAVAVSAMARRGRDALLIVYLLDLLLLLAPLFGSGLTLGGGWIEPLNPYWGIGPLVEAEEPEAALQTIGLWTVLGIAGCAIAAWRLRPAYLRQTDQRPRRGWLLWHGRVPPVGDRPVLWKELYIERLQAFGWFVKALGILLALAYVIPTLGFAGIMAIATWWKPDPAWADWAHDKLVTWTNASHPMTWLIQWAMGLRAAVAVASERQRGTWDSLLVSPLEGREIVLAKIYGGIYAMRGFILAVILSWTTALLCGALAPALYVQLVAEALLIGVFMVVMGIAFSLSSQTATRAMTLTIVSWLAAAFGFMVLAGILTMMAILALTVAWFAWSAMQGTTPWMTAGPGPPIGSWPGIFYPVIRLLLYVLAAFVVAWYCRHHFDRLAGRSYASVARMWRLRGWRTRRKKTEKVEVLEEDSALPN